MFKEVTVGTQEHTVTNAIIQRDQILGMRKKTFIAGTGMSYNPGLYVSVSQYFKAGSVLV